MPPDEMDAKKRVLDDIMAFAQEKRAGKLKAKYSPNPHIEPVPGVDAAPGSEAAPAVSPEDELAQLLPQ